MTPYADSKAAAIIRIAPHDRVPDYEAAGWVVHRDARTEAGVVVQWRMERGVVVEPAETENNREA